MVTLENLAVLVSLCKNRVLTESFPKDSSAVTYTEKQSFSKRETHQVSELGRGSGQSPTICCNPVTSSYLLVMLWETDKDIYFCLLAERHTVQVRQPPILPSSYSGLTCETRAE